jgi:L-threonylcarbamoyladenylate synthase
LSGIILKVSIGLNKQIICVIIIGGKPIEMEQLMETRIVHINNEIEFHEDELKDAGKIIGSGGLVAFPTETVYGIGANALDEVAISKIYIAKGRPSDNPLIMHIADVDWLAEYVTDISDKALSLIEAFWPGPLTMVFKKSEKVSYSLTGGLETVAVRMPNHPIARRIIKEANVPVAAPSANLSGKPSPTRGQHVIDDLSGRVDMIVDGGKSELGLESTVLDVTGDIPCILRPGSITRSMIADIVGEVSFDDHLSDESLVPKSPGMKYKHYAPKGQLSIVSGEIEEKVIEYINLTGQKLIKEGYKVGVITPEHAKGEFHLSIVESIGHVDNPTEIGSNLFKILRKMDDNQVNYIFSFEFKGEEVTVAIMNRLIKAAGHLIIEV